jgi:regulator of RNase E activity RraA
MRTGKDRVQVEGYQQPVSLGDVRVCPGDLIVGDGDAIVVVPRQRMEEVLKRALATREVEERILAAALAGMPLTEARKQFGYHTLQRSAASPLAA